MKNIVALIFAFSTVLILFNSSIASANENNNPFIGTWQLQSGEYIDGNKKLIQYASLGISSQKVINETHFGFVSLSKGKFWGAGSGHYTFSDNEYIETPTFASYPLEDGGVYKFTYEIKDDLWHSSRWHGDVRVEYEVWKRVK